MTKNEFLNIFTGLCELYKQSPSEFVLNTYYDLLKNYDLAQVQGAVDICLRTYKYNTLPKPAELLQYIEDSPNDKAISAWIQVIDAIRDYGYYDTIEFEDKIIHHCIDNFGGWMWLCSQKKTEMPFIEKRFLDLYRIFSKREFKSPPKLIGFVDAKNREKGYMKAIPETIKITSSKPKLLIMEKM